jgi:hypothetical protein
MEVSRSQALPGRPPRLTNRRTQKVFIYFAKTDNPNDGNGPNVTKYYSKEDGGVYYLYRYVEDGVLQGHLDKPWGLDALGGPHYSITPSVSVF